MCVRVSVNYQRTYAQHPQSPVPDSPSKMEDFLRIRPPLLAFVVANLPSHPARQPTPNITSGSVVARSDIANRSRTRKTRNSVPCDKSTAFYLVRTRRTGLVAKRPQWSPSPLCWRPLSRRGPRQVRRVCGRGRDRLPPRKTSFDRCRSERRW